MSKFIFGNHSHWLISGSSVIALGFSFGILFSSSFSGCSKPPEDEEISANPRIATAPSYIPPIRKEVVASTSAPAMSQAVITATTQGGKGIIKRTIITEPQAFKEIKGDFITTPSGLAYLDIVPGTGPMPIKGKTIFVDYSGWLKNGTQFDSSLPRPIPFSLRLGEHAVITGWEEGLSTMKVGGKRRLIVPPHLGYGNETKSSIPANSTLIFDIELLGIDN